LHQALVMAQLGDALAAHASGQHKNVTAFHSVVTAPMSKLAADRQVRETCRALEFQQPEVALELHQQAAAAAAAAAESSPMTSRRTTALLSAVGAAVLPVASAVARPPGGRRMKPGEKAPDELADDGDNFEEVWKVVDVGESTIVDPNDPKYKQLRILKELEKQQKKNEEFDSMTKEEKADKMCELLGRGCS